MRLGRHGSTVKQHLRLSYVLQTLLLRRILGYVEFRTSRLSLVLEL